MRQLDDGIGDTLVLALKALGDGRSRYHVTSTRPRHRRRCHRYRPARSPDRRPITIWKQTRAHFIPPGTQYKGIADTIVQLIPQSASDLIVLSNREPSSSRGRMRAGRIHRFGPPDAIVIDEIPCPTPKGVELVVRTAAAGVGPWDALIREKKSVVNLPLPIILGSDLGILVSVVSPVPEKPPQPVGVRSAFFLVEVTTSRLGTLARLFDSGKLTTQVGTLLPLEDVRTAHEMLAGAPHKRGKIVLTMHGAH
jgi:Zinc-binding dehydrogenase